MTTKKAKASAKADSFVALLNDNQKSNVKGQKAKKGAANWG
jgi:hypothetical protein